MRKAPSLKTNFKWMFMANIIFAFLQWLVLSTITKLGSSEMVGVYTLGLAITAPIMIFANLQLRAIQATDSKNENKFADFFTLRFIFMALGILLIATVLIYSDYDLQVKLIIFVIAISKAIEGMSDIVYGFLQKHEDMKKIALSLVLRGLTSVLAFTFSLYFSDSLLIATILSSVSWLLVFILLDLRMVNKYEIKRFYNLNISIIYKLFIIALPLGIVTMLGSLNTNIPRYVIENYLSIEMLGVFGAISYTMTGVGKFSSAISQTVSPRLAKYYAGDDKKSFLKLFQKIFVVNFLIGIFGVLLVLITGEELLAIMYTEEYAQYNNLFVWIMILSLFMNLSNAFGVGVTSMRLFASQLPIHIIKLVIISITSVVFIKKFGINGAAYALITSTIISIVFYVRLFITGLNKFGGKINGKN
ncbi:oligosaccharide flippase family protein [Oceanobacillus profundus]|uniref:oligosaccharide flippase family protein n=1 Tax=Oceanobacillus profundus TaxID=372463 RepID=UPI0026E38A54|nr:oligosaccharide flippase family protein [Oceanobacillus profundus]MDO6450504.1 oligosaccharide flippase family protein [Oceanobacillus profundus]